MSAFIFVTAEGYTFQPGSDSSEPDLENLQVLGIIEGNTAEQAFINLLIENAWLVEMTFDSVTCYELRYTDYQKDAAYFSIGNTIRKLKRFDKYWA